MEDEYKLKSKLKKKVWWGVINLLCKLGVHKFPEKESFISNGFYKYYGKRCERCGKEK